MKGTKAETYNAASQSCLWMFESAAVITHPLHSTLSIPMIPIPSYQPKYKSSQTSNYTTRPRRKRVHSSIYAVLIRISIVRNPHIHFKKSACWHRIRCLFTIIVFQIYPKNRIRLTKKLLAILTSTAKGTMRQLATSPHVNRQMRCQPRSRRHAMQRHQRLSGR